MQLAYQVRLDQFEGPLALLLHLIRQDEMDIYNIQIHRITQQYFDYIKKMKHLDLELAGEFVAMAATLIQIKSKMLLPQYDENGDEVEGEDPRKELVQKLLEYQKFQEAAKRLYERPLLKRDFWLKGFREEYEPAEEGDIIIPGDNPLFAMISCYRSIVRNVKKTVHKVGKKTQSIAQRILEIKSRIHVGQKTTLREILGTDSGLNTSLATNDDDAQENKLLITFLSLLELGKMGFVSLFQSEAYADIHIEGKRPIETDVIARVEEYDSEGAEDMADQIMAEALEETQTELSAEPQISLDDDDDVEESNVPEEEGLSFELQDLSFVEDESLVEAATDEEILAEEERLSSQEVQTAEASEELPDIPLMDDLSGPNSEEIL